MSESPSFNMYISILFLLLSISVAYDSDKLAQNKQKEKFLKIFGIIYPKRLFKTLYKKFTNYFL